MFLLFIVVAPLALPGCSEADKRKWRHYSSEQNYTAALEEQRGDLRREAVARIGDSGYYASEDAFHVLDAVARTDPVTQVRCVAIRALARYKDERPVPTLLAILQAAEKTDSALPAGDDVRWEVVHALSQFDQRGLVTGEAATTLRQLYIQFLRGDGNRQVRIIAARSLGYHQDREVLVPLINALRDPDFLIADNAERSLIALTGTTHDYDADAWTQWIEATEDPFAHAGEPVVTTRPAGPTWFDKQQRAWRRAFKLPNAD